MCPKLMPRPLKGERGNSTRGTLLKMANDDAEDLVPKKSGTSATWKYFGFERTDVHQVKVKCKACRRTTATSTRQIYINTTAVR